MLQQWLLETRLISPLTWKQIFELSEHLETIFISGYCGDPSRSAFIVEVGLLRSEILSDRAYVC